MHELKGGRHVLVLQVVCAQTNGFHRQLTSEERLTFFGTTSLADGSFFISRFFSQDQTKCEWKVFSVPLYRMASVRPHAIHKRSLLPNKDLFYHIDIEGKEKFLHLRPNTNLISPYFTLKPDGLGVNITAATNCLYHGKFAGGSGRAAISTCGELGLVWLMSIDWLIDWWIEVSIVWLFDWLIDWLIELSRCCSSFFKPMFFTLLNYFLKTYLPYYYDRIGFKLFFNLADGHDRDGGRPAVSTPPRTGTLPRKRHPTRPAACAGAHEKRV